MNSAIEVVTFTLKPQASTEQLLATNDAMKAFLLEQEGFLYRSLSCDESGQWFDIVYWRDQFAAKAGGEAFMASAVGATLMELIDQPSCKLRHMDALCEVMYCEVAA